MGPKAPAHLALCIDENDFVDPNAASSLLRALGLTLELSPHPLHLAGAAMIGTAHP